MLCSISRDLLTETYLLSNKKGLPPLNLRVIVIGSTFKYLAQLAAEAKDLIIPPFSSISSNLILALFE